MICEKCGFETGPSAKFCAVCGAPVVPVQQPEPAPEVKSGSASGYFSVAPSEVVPAEVNVAAEPETVEAAAPIDTFFEASEAEAAEVQVYNSEMAAPEAFVQEEAPVAPAPEIPPVMSFEPAPQNVTAPPCIFRRPYVWRTRRPGLLCSSGVCYAQCAGIQWRSQWSSLWRRSCVRAGL